MAHKFHMRSMTLKKKLVLRPIVIPPFCSTVTLEINQKALNFTPIFNMSKFCNSVYNFKQNFWLENSEYLLLFSQ